MLERRERVEQWARKEEQGVGSRSHARAGWVVRRWLVGRWRRERGGVYASSSIWWAVRRFFVSQVVLSCTLGETAGRAVQVAERVRLARSAPRLSLDCRLCLDPGRVSALLHANFHPPNMLRDRKNLATTSSPANRHTLVDVLHPVHTPAIYMITLANIHADQHMPAEHFPRPSRCLSTSRPPNSSGEDAQAPR